MRWIKRILLFLVIVIVIVFTALLVFIKSIAVEVTDADLPEAVYTDTSNLRNTARLSLLGLITADEEDRYTIVENFINYIILDSIRTNINSAYDPLSEDDTIETNDVIYQNGFYIDYVFATLNENNQIVVCISFGTDQYIHSDSAIYLVFDVDITMEFLNVTLTLTLDQYYLADKEMSIGLLDYIFNQLDKTAIEESITSGTLNLTDYTYSISLIN